MQRTNCVDRNIPPFKVVVMSLLLALFADIKCMTSIIEAFSSVSEDSSIMSVLYFGIVISTIFMSIISSTMKMNQIGASVIITVIYCLFLYYCTTSFVGPTSVTFHYFLVFTIAAFCIPSIVKVDPEIVIKAIMCLPAIGILKSDVLFEPEYNGVAITMGQSYAFLIPILATAIYLVFYFLKETRWLVKLFMLIISLVNIFYLSMLLMYGSRGPIVCVIGLLFFIFAIKPRQNGYGITIKKRFLLIGIICVLAGILLFEQMIELVMPLSKNSYAIQKYIYLSQEGDITNGRNLVYSLSWNGFLSSPIFGNGFAQFFRNTGQPYPHNSVLQILYDGGLLFATIIFIPLIKKIKALTKSMSRNQYMLFAFSLFAGFVGSMFSDDLWMQPMLWLFFGIVLTNNNIIYNE